MIFLNLILIGGLVTIGAPIVIHLFRRNRVVPLDWGAMMFLEKLMAERSRSINLRDWLLLLLRVLILACLALAMMRPAIRMFSAGARPSDVHTSAAILLDDSYSMNVGRARTAWHEAREMALRYIDSLRKGDDVAVFFASSAGLGTPPAALFDMDRAREVVKSASPQHTSIDFPRAVMAALQHLETRHNPRRELVVFTDGQAAGWNLGDARWSYLAATVRDSAKKPHVIVASTRTKRPENLVLLDIKPERGVVDPYTPVGFHATVANEGPEPVKNATVTFRVDGATKSSRSVDLPGGGREVVAFEHKFKRPGSHYVSCRLRSAQDELGDDNEILHSVLVSDRLPVLLVDGDPRYAALGSETGFLRLAIAPKDDEDPTWRTVIEPTVIDATDLRHTDFSKYRVVVLANVAALPGAVVAELERFVVGGGGVLVALGDRVQAEAYNRDLYRQGAGLLPAALGESVDLEVNPALAWIGAGKPEGDGGLHLAGILSGTPALDLFRPENGQDWTKAGIRGFFMTQPSAEAGEKVRTLATFSNGRPALIQKQLGEGKVILFTSAVDMGWSDLPVHPFYVPLMQNLVFELASAVIPPRNLTVGRFLSHVASGDAARKAWYVYPPEGEPVRLKPQRQGELTVYTHEHTRKPGLYVVGPETAEPGERVHYSVTADRRESAMARLSERDITRLQRDLGISHVTDWGSLARRIGLGSGGYEISRHLIWLTILLCFFEIYLTRRWS